MMASFIKFRGIVVNASKIHYCIVTESSKKRGKYTLHIQTGDVAGVAYTLDSEKEAKDALSELYFLINPHAPEGHPTTACTEEITK